MTLRKSFLADCKENFKRRNWVFWLQLLALFICLPGALLLGLNSINRDYQLFATISFREKMLNYSRIIFDLNPVISAVIILLAVLAGLQAFSWLHNKKKVNFYHSQPISRNRRFLVIWLNGVVSFLITYLVNLLLGMAIAASFGCLQSQILVVIPKAVLAHLLLFLAVYQVAIVAVMLTGHTLVSLSLTAVLLLYEVSVRALIWAYGGSFFRTYGSTEGRKVLNTLFSPLVTFYYYSFGRDANSYNSYGWAIPTYKEMVFSMLGLVLLFGLAGWLLYKKRPAEGHGKSIVFSGLKNPLEVLLLLALGMTGGIFIYVISGSEVLGIGGIIFTVVISHVIIRLIYEVDFRAIKKGVPGMLLSLVMVIFIFCAFRWDIFGYDKWIPDKKRVESVALSLESNYMGENWVLTDGTEIRVDDYWPSKMQLKDLEMVYRLLDKRVNIEEFEEYDYLYRLNVVFKQKSGKTMDRVFYFSYEENLEEMNEIFHTREYQTATNQVMEDNFAENYKIFQAEYGNGQMDYVIPEDKVLSLLRAYVMDVNQVDFAHLYNAVPAGRITFGGQGIKNPEYVNEWRVTIYPSFTHTLSLLKECDIATEAVRDQEYLEQIKSILVIYTDREAFTASGEIMMSEKYEKKLLFLNEAAVEEEAEEYRGRADELFYVDEQVLQEILEPAYLSEPSSWNPYEGTRRMDMEVHVELQDIGYSGEDVSYVTSNYDYYCFAEGRVPEVVQKALKK